MMGDITLGTSACTVVLDIEFQQTVAIGLDVENKIITVNKVPLRAEALNAVEPTGRVCHARGVI